METFRVYDEFDNDFSESSEVEREFQKEINKYNSNEFDEFDNAIKEINKEHLQIINELKSKENIEKYKRESVDCFIEHGGYIFQPVNKNNDHTCKLSVRDFSMLDVHTIQTLKKNKINSILRKINEITWIPKGSIQIISEKDVAMQKISKAKNNEYINNSINGNGVIVDNDEKEKENLFKIVLFQITCNAPDDTSIENVYVPKVYSILNALQGVVDFVSSNIESENIDEYGYGTQIVSMKILLVDLCKFVKIESNIIYHTAYKSQHMCLKVYDDKIDDRKYRTICFSPESHEKVHFVRDQAIDPYGNPYYLQTGRELKFDIYPIHKFDSMYVCKSTGIVHICGEDCDKLIRNNDYSLICPISNKIYENHIVTDPKDNKKFTPPEELKNNQIRYKKDIGILLNGAYKKESERYKREKEEKREKVRQLRESGDFEEAKKVEKLKIDKPLKRKRKFQNFQQQNSINNLIQNEKDIENTSLQEIMNNPNKYTKRMDFIKSKRNRSTMMNYDDTKLHNETNETRKQILMLERLDQNKKKVQDIKESCLAFVLKIILNIFSDERFQIEQNKNIDIENQIIKNWSIYEKRMNNHKSHTCAMDYMMIATNIRSNNPTYIKFNFTSESRLNLSLSYSRRILCLWYIMRKYTNMVPPSITHYYFSNFVISAMRLFQKGCIISIPEEEKEHCHPFVSSSPSKSLEYKQQMMQLDYLSDNDDEEETQNRKNILSLYLEKKNEYTKDNHSNIPVNQNITIIKKDELLQDGCLSINTGYIPVNNDGNSAGRKHPITSIEKEIHRSIEYAIKEKMLSPELFKIENVEFETIPSFYFKDINTKN